jgi:hypothetical protein
MMDFDSFTQVLEDLKYLNRLTKFGFVELLFPNSTDDYAERKWAVFYSNPLYFLWSCSSDKLLILLNYIEEEKA